MTLIIGIFYCLNYTLPLLHLLLHLITTHLVSHLSLSSIVFTVSTLIIGIFYCLYYTSQLLHLFIIYLVIYNNIPCFSRFLVKFLPIFKVLLKIPSECLSRSTCSENFQRNIKIRRFSVKNWVISHNVILKSTQTNKTKS